MRASFLRRPASPPLEEKQVSQMNSVPESDIDQDDQLELIELLDERFRLRDDATRRSDLEEVHARLREKLHGAKSLEDGHYADPPEQPVRDGKRGK